jgi:hypothetical protein
MSASRPPSVAIYILFVLVVSAPILQPTLLARAGAQAPAAANAAHGEAPDPCERALTPDGNANGLHRRCAANGGGAGVGRGDFNGDGLADLAIGAPFEDIDGVNAVGVVQVLYAAANGLTASGDQLLDMRTFGYTLNSGAHFGWALAAGNFNGDMFSDLAIGVPDYDYSFNSSGTVVVIDGSPQGLALATARTIHSVSLARGGMGTALVWGNFNGDAYADLAIGIPEASVRGEGFACSPAGIVEANAGEVQVLYGSDSGLTEFGAQVLHQGHCDFGDRGKGVGDAIEAGDRFGASLTALSDRSGADDLVIGVPNEDLGLFDKIDAGVVHVIPGSSAGLDPDYATTLSQDTAGIGGGAESNDQFGRVLGAGNFNGGAPDLVIGVPFEDLSSNAAADAGAVHVIYDVTAFGFDPSDSVFISQASLAGVTVESGDRFGWAVAAGDFNFDEYDDLAIGVPGEDFNSLSNPGLVQLINGSANGLLFSSARALTQDSTGIADVAESGDQFGYALSSWNFGVSASRDLAIGVPFEDLVSTITGTLVQDAGAVHVLYGSSTGIQSAGNQFWTQDTPGVLDAAQAGDRFGQSLY